DSSEVTPDGYFGGIPQPGGVPRFQTSSSPSGRPRPLRPRSRARPGNAPRETLPPVGHGGSPSPVARPPAPMGAAGSASCYPRRRSAAAAPDAASAGDPSSPSARRPGSAPASSSAAA